MKILKNAVEAIQIGLEDYKSEDARRAQSALRNIFAGMLLLFKEQLRRLSPEDSDEVLLKQVIMPSQDENETIKFQGKGKKTVDVQQIRARFTSLGISIDWKSVNQINELRNNIEHYYTDHSPAVINEIVSKSFKIIRDFCVNVLHTEPVELFGKGSWDIFLEVDEVYEKEKEESIDSLSQIDWGYDTLVNAGEHIRCPTCSSDLIRAQDVLVYVAGEDLPLMCNKCSEVFNFSSIIEDCVSEVLAGEAHIECPECAQSAYVFAEDLCLCCGHHQVSKTCAVCGTYLDLEESYDGNICSYHRWAMEKAARED